MSNKDCKICRTVTEDARYVAAIEGWRCNDCDLIATMVQMPLLKEVKPCVK